MSPQSTFSSRYVEIVQIEYRIESGKTETDYVSLYLFGLFDFGWQSNETQAISETTNRTYAALIDRLYITLVI